MPTEEQLIADHDTLIRQKEGVEFGIPVPTVANILDNIAKYATQVGAGKEATGTAQSLVTALETALRGGNNTDTINTLRADLATILTLVGPQAGDGDTVVNTVREMLVVLQGFQEGVDIAQQLQSALTTANSALQATDGFSERVGGVEYAIQELELNKVDSNDSRLSDARMPLPGSVDFTSFNPDLFIPENELIADGSITEAKLSSGVVTKLNSSGSVTTNPKLLRIPWTGASGQDGLSTTSGTSAAVRVESPGLGMVLPILLTTGTTTTGTAVNFLKPTGNHSTARGSYSTDDWASFEIRRNIMVPILSDVNDPFLVYFGMSAHVATTTNWASTFVGIKIDGATLSLVTRVSSVDTAAPETFTLTAGTVYRTRQKWTVGGDISLWINETLVTTISGSALPVMHVFPQAKSMKGGAGLNPREFYHSGMDGYFDAILK